jgi:hypothetical protein
MHSLSIAGHISLGLSLIGIIVVVIDLIRQRLWGKS